MQTILREDETKLRLSRSSNRQTSSMFKRLCHHGLQGDPAQPSRNQQIVRRVILSVAILSFVACTYVGSYLTVSWAYHDQRSMTAHVIAISVGPVWAPLSWYKVSEFPLSREFATLEEWVNQGGTKSWDESRQIAAITIDNGKRGIGSAFDDLIR